MSLGSWLHYRKIDINLHTTATYSYLMTLQIRETFLTKYIPPMLKKEKKLICYLMEAVLLLRLLFHIIATVGQGL